MNAKLTVYIGWDPRETDAYNVCAHSLVKRSSVPLLVKPVVMSDLQREGLYYRATERRGSILWDVVSDAPMSTEFAISRFFVPLLAKRDKISSQFALFCDCDFLWLSDVAELIGELDANKALACVQHQYTPSETLKMDGQAQTIYHRKNWSSLMAFNLSDPAHDWLNLEKLNNSPGRDLHRFCWLSDDRLQSLSPDWNWLEGTSPPLKASPRAVHFTRGGPWMEGWKNVDYAEMWLAERDDIKIGR